MSVSAIQRTKTIAKRIRRVSPRPTSSNKPKMTKVQPPKIVLAAPIGGWRNPTVNDALVIARISERPNLTPREYGDQLGLVATEVNNCLLYTKSGRMLAESGKVAVPTKRRPRWAHLVMNKHLLHTRKREFQFGDLHLTRVAKGDNKASLIEVNALIKEISLTASPRLLQQVYLDLTTKLIEISKARAAEQAKLAKLAQ